MEKQSHASLVEGGNVLVSTFEIFGIKGSIEVGFMVDFTGLVKSNRIPRY